MNLGVETVVDFPVCEPVDYVSAFSDESWGGDRHLPDDRWLYVKFQHSLMNLGVETILRRKNGVTGKPVSAFSDESWGGDPDCRPASTRAWYSFSIL